MDRMDAPVIWSVSRRISWNLLYFIPASLPGLIMLDPFRIKAKRFGQIRS